MKRSEVNQILSEAIVLLEEMKFAGAGFSPALFALYPLVIRMHGGESGMITDCHMENTRRKKHPTMVFIIAQQTHRATAFSTGCFMII